MKHIKHNLPKTPWWAPAVLLITLLAVVPVLAQTGGLFDLSWHSIDGGGSSSGGGYALSGAAGQPDAGVSAGGDFTLASGFWSGGLTVENQAPTNIQLDNNTIEEGLPANTQVGTLTTTDPDAGDIFIYTLVSGAGDSGNSAFNISGALLRTSQILDYDQQTTYSIRVRTTDSGGLFYEKAFTINVLETSTPIYQIYLPLIGH